ncbi:MAG: hypothetical protein SF029_11090 [bacterium]|nr:hypothetical protein [bacterium]
MYKAKVDQLGHDVKQTLDRYGVNYRRFMLSITIPKAYFEKIKNNFPNRPTDFSIVEGKDNWTITFHDRLDSPADFEQLKTLLK